MAAPFGELLAAWLDEKQVSGQALGRTLGYADGSPVRKWKRNEAEPKYSTIVRIAEALGIEPYEMMLMPGESATQRAEKAIGEGVAGLAEQIARDAPARPRRGSRKANGSPPRA